MKKYIALLLVLCMGCSLLTGCGTPAEEPAEEIELIVFAAASLTETLTEIGNAYMAENENVSIVFHFDSSGTLKTQIQEGADCDIFLSAGQAQMDDLDSTAIAARVDLLENTIVLAVAEGDPAGLGSFEILHRALTEEEIVLSIGGADVPVGDYARSILAYWGLPVSALEQRGVLTYGSNVKEITTQISEAAVDGGIIYATDAFSAGLTVVDTATADMCGQVIYPAAVLNTATHPAAAKAFLAYLRSDEADRVFESVGFTPAA